MATIAATTTQPALPPVLARASVVPATRSAAPPTAARRKKPVSAVHVVPRPTSAALHAAKRANLALAASVVLLRISAVIPPAIPAIPATRPRCVASLVHASTGSASRRVHMAKCL